MKKTKSPSERAFTLLELVVVLTILAIVTHIAVNQAAKFGHTRYAAESRQTIQAIETAILGDRFSRGDDGLPTFPGFLSDVGRLPYSLDELFSPPENLGGAWRTEITKTEDGTELTLHIGSSWRGPYIRLPAGAKKLRDAYGDPIEYHAEKNSGARTIFIENLRGDAALTNKIAPATVTISYNNSSNAPSRIFIFEDLPPCVGSFSAPVPGGEIWRRFLLCSGDNFYTIP